MRPVLELSQVSFSYHLREREVLALKDVSFHVDVGEFVAIVGPSGCGKSTLLSMIAGLISPGNGIIRVDGLSCDVTIRKSAT